ncbi:RIP metalloprotease RseP [Hydrogenimonas cancrithermarum]|uniref:Zinc metalloprotease n=1 Tax=Hydrogenimonas cancrithermarum TaxID=2993563 RepID=A0ABN6WS01_9BACT|nr:RIP metalloprotease RseP [Hydrogenimonas cancrithermarum]BDY11856.1 putative zinc metalloprotease [Hydrogenimonas cancrithermarum]
MGMLVSLLVLSFLIFFHELGHFLAARFFGVHVERFSIGFGKVVFSKVVNGTEYALSAIPLGGYVKMKGQDDADPTKISYDPDSYNVKPPWQRILILLGGPFFNFLLAFVLYYAIALLGANALKPVVGMVQPDSPAAEVGLKKGDRIVEINNHPIEIWDDLSETIKASDGPIGMLVDRNGTILSLTVVPRVLEAKNMFGESVRRRMVGIAPSGDIVTIHYDPFHALTYAWERTVEASKLIVVSVEKLIEGVVPAKDMGGVIAIVQVTAEASQHGLVALLALTALISVNLGVLNLLPIPALDGGHIIFTLYEMIFRRPLNEEVVYRLTLGGWALLLTLMAFTIYNDITRITNG